MAGFIPKLSRFWQEAKRRNVIRRNTVYAATAFVILELISIIQEPLKLPEWTLLLVIILLSVGFVVSVLVSWMYDYNADGTLEKTNPLPGKSPEEKSTTISPAWRLATYISFALIIGLIVLNILPRRNPGQRESDREGAILLLEKSIAVLPFINDSPDEENAYFINGTMEAILDNLCKIEDLRVVSRTSVEQYRENHKPLPEVAKEMNVAYVLEGSGQRYGNQIRLTLQLIDAANDRHLWSIPYVREIELENIFTLQSEIAQLVASEIKAVITPEEKQRIEKIPTTSQTAYDLFQRAIDLHGQRYSYQNSLGSFEEAERLYQYAIGYDSAFAEAYLNLGWLYWDWYEWNRSKYPGKYDSAVYYVDKALDLDPQLARAYSLKGYLLSTEGEDVQAIASFQKAIEFNPNSFRAYNGMAWLYFSKTDYVNAIHNFYQTTQLDLDPNELASRYNFLGYAFAFSGFKEHADHYYQESLKLSGDSSLFVWYEAFTEHLYGNFSQAVKTMKMAIADYPGVPYFFAVKGKSQLFLGENEEALESLERFKYLLDSTGTTDIYFIQYIALANLKNGNIERAEFLADHQITFAKEMIAKQQPGFGEQYYYMAQSYAVKGNKEGVLSSLNQYNKLERMNISIVTLRDDPIFEQVKDDPEFNRIFDELEAKYQTEHERVQRWLEKNDML